MSYLMHIAFDSSERFLRKVHYMTYKGYRFKMIQGDGRKFSNVLLTVLNDDSRLTQEGAYRAAGEYLAALAWERETIVHLGDTGGIGWGNFVLSKAKCQIKNFRGLPYMGALRGGLVDEIALVSNEYQTQALTLFREARSTNNHYLKFLFYWQILEVRNANPVNWVNKVIRKTDGKVTDRSLLGRDELRGRNVGNYLYDDCRCAIAHLRRNAGKASITLDSLKDAVRIGIGLRIVEDLARYYIADNLGVKETQYLVRRRTGDKFPFFATLGQMQKENLYLAYDRWIPSMRKASRQNAALA